MQASARIKQLTKKGAESNFQLPWHRFERAWTVRRSSWWLRAFEPAALFRKRRGSARVGRMTEEFCMPMLQIKHMSCGLSETCRSDRKNHNSGLRHCKQTTQTKRRIKACTTPIHKQIKLINTTRQQYNKTTTKQQQNNNKTTIKQQQNNNKTTTKQQQNNNKNT